MNKLFKIPHIDVITIIQLDCFGLKQRISNWFSNTIRCRDSQNSYVQYLMDIEKKHPPILHDDFKRIINGKIVKIKIIETSRLQLDANVMHPFVRVHIVDKNTGCYLRRQDHSDEPIIYHSQTITTYDQTARKYESTKNDIILPFATTCCDFRTLGRSSGNWNQQFYINFSAEKFFNQNTLILFQLLDFNHYALLNKDISDSENLVRIAWGYLRPLGISKVHIGKSRIQLNRYKFTNKTLDQKIKKSFIPYVYYDFIWNNHEKYGGHLNVQLNQTKKPKFKFVKQQQQYPNNLFEEQRLQRKYLEKFDLGGQQKQEKDQKKINQKLVKFYRNGDRCQIPKDLIYKLQSDKLGAFRGKFIGDKVFIASSTKKNTVIKVYLLESGEQKLCLKGHRQMIYQMTTTTNQKYLITCGSDHFVRVWQIPQNVGQYIDEDQSQQYIKGQCLHSAAVYSACGIHYPMKDLLSITTCCFDGYLRVWTVDLKTKISQITKQISINNYQRTPQKVYPTVVTIFENSFFIVGDSYGDVRIFDISSDSFNLRSIYSHQQLTKDLIIQIKILNKTHILIQSSDNLIRHFEISNNKLKILDKYVGAQFQQYIIPFTVSPDNKYILSPSQNGKPYLWDLLTGIQIDIQHLNLQIKGPLSCCDWHPKYNLVLFCGFVELCPAFIYGNILSQAESKLVIARNG